MTGKPVGVGIERLHALPADRVAPLITESEQAGPRFVRRLAVLVAFHIGEEIVHRDELWGTRCRWTSGS